MTASEAKLESAWRSIPPIIRLKIEKATEYGLFTVCFYKTLNPDAFKDIDTTLLKLQLLGYNTEYGKVYIGDPNTADITPDTDITTDIKLTIKW